MILQRLYQLAVREDMLAENAFEEQPVPYVVLIDRQGNYLGVQERRGMVTKKAAKKGAPAKATPDKGRAISVPRPHGNTANQGFARFFVDTLPRLLPVEVDEKDRVKAERSRATFWQQVEQAVLEGQDEALIAVQAFGRQVQSDSNLASRVRAELDAANAGPGDRCTFAWEPDQGRTILERPALRAWYASYFNRLMGEKQESGPRGVCQITGQIVPLPKTHAMKIGGIPGGLPTGVSIVSYDKAAFESYGLEGTANAGIGFDAADGYLRAIVALIGNKLHGNPRTSLRVGQSLFLFWTRMPADTQFMDLFEAEPDQFAHLLKSLHTGAESDAIGDANDFYVLVLSGNSARAIVRDYLESPLPKAKANLRTWFDDLSIADISKEGAGKPSCKFPLWQLAVATALEADQVAPETPVRLVTAALSGGPVCESLLVACLRRLRAEGASGFRAARMGLIKLILLRREVPVTETLDANEQNRAYVYGRLLAIFEQIQYSALGDVNATVVDKFYGTFSAAPALVFSRLYSNAQNHLRKLRGDKPGSFVALDKLLTEVSALLPASPPSSHLSLQDQGRFALGYYHQRARQFEQIADRKAKAAAEAT